jgi:hypothetical protein
VLFRAAQGISSKWREGIVPQIEMTNTGGHDCVAGTPIQVKIRRRRGLAEDRAALDGVVAAPAVARTVAQCLRAFERRGVRISHSPRAMAPSVGMRDTLSRTYLLRQTADYGLDDVMRIEAERALRRAREFVSAIDEKGREVR